MSLPVLIGLAGFQLLSSAQQAESLRESAQLYREIDELNAGYAEVDAWKAEQEGYTQEARYQSVIDQTIANQRATLISQDVDVNFGTAKALIEESKVTGFLNKLDIRNQAHQQALGYLDQAHNYRIQGALRTSQAAFDAASTKSAGLMNAGSTFISGYSKTKGAV